MNRIIQTLHDEQENHIMPFLWLHGADDAITLELLRRIHACGIGAVCLESRPHLDFLGDGWWHDVDMILEEAKQLGMRVWIMDDRHYPTGMANGAAKDAPEHLKRICLTEKHYDIKGPVSGDKLNISRWLNVDPADGCMREDYYHEKIEAVILGRLCAGGSIGDRSSDRILTDMREVTGQIENGWLYLELPEGEYRVYVLTRKLHASKILSDGISFLEPDSVRLLLQTVYEPHYRRYAEYFGNTLAGFFSDEPGFFNLNDKGYGDTDRTGETSVPLPWTDDVYSLLKDEFGNQTGALLPFLFGAKGTLGIEKKIRVKYMDIVSEKYAENFTGQIREWCRQRKAEYIGHIVEDYPGYERLGQSAAHYFRAIRGQDMAGIDVVLGDLLPDEDEGKGKFYHYGLPQLAASLANQSERQRGRAMCELFGAYGWSEGITLMKWMTDFMLVHGINEFVPHAFTDTPFPDQDCPPHFWAGGNNPQYPYMKYLFSYMNRMAHLLSGGTPLIETAILFEAESDWAGETESYFELGKLLLTSQKGYHLVCLDDMRNAYVEGNKLHIGNMAYSHIFIGRLAYMDERTAELLAILKSQGADISFVGGRSKAYDGTILPGLNGISSITKEEALFKAGGRAGIWIEPFGRRELDGDALKWMRCYSYRQGGQIVHMIMNTSGKEKCRMKLCLSGEPDCENNRWIRYDVMNRRMYRIPYTGEENKTIVLDTEFDPLESRIYLENSTELDHSITEEVCRLEYEAGYQGEYHIWLASYQNPEEWRDCGTVKKLFDIARRYPDFAGKVRYEISFQNHGFKKMKLTGVNEAVEVFWGEQSLGTLIAPPYEYELPSCLTAGNCEGILRLRIEMATTLVNAVPDPISCKRPIPPTGLLGEIIFMK